MIGVTLHFSCGGCFKTVDVKREVRNVFRSFSGRSHGFGTRAVEPSIHELVETTTPEGWIAFDPYTQCTYCPECWASIESDDPTPKDAAMNAEPGEEG